MSHKLTTLAGPNVKTSTINPKYPPKKSTPTGIDPAYPNKNFVKSCYENKNDMEGYHKYMWGDMEMSMYGENKPPQRKASGYGHSIGQRAGKLRTSGKGHRIGASKRAK